jgi:hypothetical protein
MTAKDYLLLMGLVGIMYLLADGIKETNEQLCALRHGRYVMVNDGLLVDEYRCKVD